jgi:iron complex outermembrane receptor protein
MSVSTLAMTLALAAAASAAEPAASSADVIVTGTNIRGVAPVGSSIIPLGRQEFTKQGVSTTTDLLRKLPQVLNYGAGDDLTGGASVQNSAINTVFAHAINLRGLGTDATLTLFNSHRIAPGSVGQLVDVDSIPAAAIERVEVVADGASAIYGADAVAGVVNFLFRKPFTGAETTGRYGWADGRQQWMVSQVLGLSWESGGVLAVYEHQHRDPLHTADRPNLYNDDFSAYGSTPSSAFSSPGNVVIGTSNYAIPKGQNGSNVTLSQLGSPTAPNRMNGWSGGIGIAGGERNTGLVHATQQITPWLRVFGDGLFSRRDYEATVLASGLAYANATLTVPSANPFSPCAPGKSTANTQGLVCPSNGNLSVAYSFLNDLGPIRRTGHSEVWELTGGLEVSLPMDWKATGIVTTSKDREYTRDINQPNTNALSAVLGLPSTANVPVKPANIPYFNPFCDGSGFSCNDPATINYIRAVSGNLDFNDLTDVTINVGGSLFSLPAGSVRLALGGEYARTSLTHVTFSSTGSAFQGPPATIVDTPAPVSRREVKSFYAELYVPIVGEANAVPGIQQLELNIAGRYDDYSDFGSTKNPKVGINWTPLDGIKVHASYGKSFRAPTLQQINPYAAGGFLIRPPGGVVTLDPGAQAPPANPQVIFPIGGNPSLRPERARTFSVGLDLAPRQLAGFSASANYYNIKYADKIDTPTFNAGAPTAINSGFYNQFLVLNPRYFPVRSTVTTTAFDAMVAAVYTTPGLPAIPPVPQNPANILALIDARSVNSAVINTDGMDLAAHYRWDAGPMGAFTVGANATWVMHYETAPSPSAPVLDQVNVFTYPLRWRLRGELGWQLEHLNAQVYVNYANGYHMLPTQLPLGVAASYADIGAYTTVDFSVTYNTGARGDLLKDIQLSVSAQNLFDAAPPLVLNGGRGAVRFDPQNASPLGREVAVQLTKRF